MWRLLPAYLQPLHVVFYQLWLFIAPGLYRKEQRFALPFLLSTVVLVIFTIAAIVTPTADILNMCLFAAPMVALRYQHRSGLGGQFQPRAWCRLHLALSPQSS